MSNTQSRTPLRMHEYYRAHLLHAPVGMSLSEHLISRDYEKIMCFFMFVIATCAHARVYVMLLTLNNAHHHSCACSDNSMCRLSLLTAGMFVLNIT